MFSQLGRVELVVSIRRRLFPTPRPHGGTIDPDSAPQSQKFQWEVRDR